jgi:hypothetical protein
MFGEAEHGAEANDKTRQTRLSNYLGPGQISLERYRASAFISLDFPNRG